MTTENARAAVSKVDQLIRDPRSRQQFHQDPHATLRNAGADPGDVPTAVWEILTDMTPAELDAIVALGVAMAEAGLIDGDHSYGIII